MRKTYRGKRVFAVFSMTVFLLTSLPHAATLMGFSGNELFRIDTISGTTTTIATIPVPSMGMSSAQFQNNLYLLGYDAPGGSPQIYSVNMTNGAYSYASLSTPIAILACRSEGSLVGLNGTQLLLINPSTGGTSVIGTAVIPSFCMSQAKSGNTLYVLGADAPGGTVKIYIVNLVTGGVTVITPNVVPSALGMRADGMLIGITGTQVFLINTSTGITSVIGSVSIASFSIGGGYIGNSLYLNGADGAGGSARVYKVNMLTGGSTLVSPSSVPMTVAMNKTPVEEPSVPLGGTPVPATSAHGLVLALALLGIMGVIANGRKKIANGLNGNRQKTE